MSLSAEVTPRSANFEYERRDPRKGMRGLIGAVALWLGMSDAKADDAQATWDGAVQVRRNRRAVLQRVERMPAASGHIHGGTLLESAFNDQALQEALDRVEFRGRMQEEQAHGMVLSHRRGRRAKQIRDSIPVRHMNNRTEMELGDNALQVAMASLGRARFVGEDDQPFVSTAYAHDTPTAEVINLDAQREQRRGGRHRADVGFMREETAVLPQIPEAA